MFWGLILIFIGFFLIFHKAIYALIITFLVYLFFSFQNRNPNLVLKYLIFFVLLILLIKFSIFLAPLIFIGLGIYLLTSSQGMPWRGFGRRGMRKVWKRNFWRW